MKRTDIQTVEALLVAYHDASLHRIAESSDIAGGARRLDADMEVIARNLGSGWYGCDCEGTYYGFDGSDEP